MSDPYTYVGIHPRDERAIALTLRGPLDVSPTRFEIPREDAHRLLSDIAKVLFATASHDPRPAEPAPLADNDEIDAIVGALAALTDRVRALEEPKAAPCDTATDKRIGRLEAHATIARQEFKIGKERLDDIEGGLSALTERVHGLSNSLGGLECELAVLRALVGHCDVSTVAEELEALRRKLPQAVIRSARPKDRTRST
jgi:hypothetical protein